jgi:dipeptidyl aminopeptidase/acylaminoacyl peptidase
LSPGWHVYSLTQPAGGPQRTKITLEESAGFKLAGDFHAAPAPKSRIDETVWKGLEIQEHEGEVHWYAPLSLAVGKDLAGLAITGKVSMQACAESCMPLQLKFTAELERSLADELARLPGVDLAIVAGKKSLDAPKAHAAAPADDSSMAVRLKDVPLIPRETLFGDPPLEKFRMLSPDGKRLSLIKPLDGVLNVWVAPAEKPEDAKPVTRDKHRPITGHSWSFDSKHIIYLQDNEGDENYHLYAVNVETDETKDLTPVEGVQAKLQAASEKYPGELLVGLNDRNPQFHDVYRIDIATGERTLVQENEGFVGFLTDDEFNLKLAIRMTPDGGQEWLEPTGKPGEKGFSEWKLIETIPADDAMTSGLAGIDKERGLLYFQDSRDRNTSALFARDLDSGEATLIAEDPRTDVIGAILHPTKKNVQAVWFCYSRQEWKVLDPEIQPDVDFLRKFNDGDFVITSRTLDDSQWIVAYIQDDGPVKFYRYERPIAKDESADDPSDDEGSQEDSQNADNDEDDDDGSSNSAHDDSTEKKRPVAKPQMHFLFNHRDDLEQYPLVKMHTPVIKSRDGLEMVSYLSLPPGTDPDGDGLPNEPVPMVLDVHGGPWVREAWGFNAHHQWLANRGYAVLTVNYRGSTGFGKDFIAAGHRQWSLKMHEDLLDAVQWAVENRIALRDKVAIMGGSYGGYATLVGLTFTPKVFACGVDIVGPSSLVSLLESTPAYWLPLVASMKTRIGDWTTEEGKQDLLARSPLTHADRIERPLLIGQGANDPRVPQREADQIVQAMTEKKIPVTYVLYPDEGHGFARAENRKSFNAIIEAFLAEHLGGRYEPVGDSIKGSSLTVPAGADGVPGLAEAIQAHASESVNDDE